MLLFDICQWRSSASVQACARPLFPNFYLSAAFKRYTNQQALPAFQIGRVNKTLNVMGRLLVRPNITDLFTTKASASISAALTLGLFQFCFTGEGQQERTVSSVSRSKLTGHGFTAFHNLSVFQFSIFFLYRSRAILLFCCRPSTTAGWYTYQPALLWWSDPGSLGNLELAFARLSVNSTASRWLVCASIGVGRLAREFVHQFVFPEPLCSFAIICALPFFYFPHVFALLRE